MEKQEQQPIQPPNLPPKTMQGTQIEKILSDNLDTLTIKANQNTADIFRNKKEILASKNVLSLIIEALKRAEILENGNQPGQIRLHKELLNEGDKNANN